MHLDPTLVAYVVLLVALSGIALDLILIRIRRTRVRAPSLGRYRLATDESTLSVDAAVPEARTRLQRAAIVDQMDRIEKANKRQMQSLMASMVESQDWRALAEQFSLLFDEQVNHLRALARRYDRTVGPEEALRHTVDAFRISCLILDLYDELVAESDIVKDVLDRWLQMERGMTLDEFTRKMHLDCARILLLDLGYASPPPASTRAQLEMAEGFCHEVVYPDSIKHPSALSVLSEIELRKERITQ